MIEISFFWPVGFDKVVVILIMLTFRQTCQPLKARNLGTFIFSRNKPGDSGQSREIPEYKIAFSFILVMCDWVLVSCAGFLS